MKTKAWSFLERLPGLTALPVVWRQHLGAEYAAFKRLCLQAETWQAAWYPCAREQPCGCWHEVRWEPGQGGAVAVCQCEPVRLVEMRFERVAGQEGGEWRLAPVGSLAAMVETAPRGKCADLALTLEEVTPLKVHRARLAREICRALSLEAKYEELPLPNTFQAGTWSAESVPVIVTIQAESQPLRQVVSELALRLGRPFILLGPTHRLVSVATEELLAHARSGFLALENCVELTAEGGLRAAQPPGVLLARWTPQPREGQEDAARQLFALAKALDSVPGMQKAPPSAVLQLYCVEGLGILEIARRLKCHRALVWGRMKLLRQKLGRSLNELREMSGQFEKIEESLRDPRARRIHRASALDEAGGEEDENE